MSAQAKLLPVKSLNLPDIFPMTGCYLQACIQNFNTSDEEMI